MSEKILSELTATIGAVPYQTILTANNHSYIADEPEADGGTDLGMAPFQLLLGSLGACTAITLKMYAQRKGWDLKEARVNLTLGAMSAEKVTMIERQIHLEGDLTDEQRSRILQIANACPVHKVLTNSVVVESSLSN